MDSPTPKILIPDRLKNHLNDTEDLKVCNLIHSITNLLSSHADFFPEYTEHGIPHVNRVLELADKLIPDDTLNRLRAEDICFLISAVILHDIGMFLSVDGVRKLLFGSWKTKCTSHLDKDNWENTWEKYKSEVKRFSGEKMFAAFGELINTDNIQTDIQKMQRSDYLVIGEFLRRHHPRLAHEIAMYGFPGSVTNNIMPNDFSHLHRNLVGLIARSHGMAMRKTEGYLNTRLLGNPKKPCSCPVFYLMAVLRIADLLDAGKHRAPETKQKRQAVFIPLSLQEWSWNQKVDIANYAWDERASLLTIVGEPECSTEYVRLKGWLENIQQELDLCWAIIMEKYAADYALSIHRVDSPILDPESETYRDRFLPRKAMLRANPALLNHLVGPLYGDDPSYGVRELVQNAVDACLERENIEKKAGNNDYAGTVTVNINTHAGTFTIEDNGIGMNEDVLLNYYLSAGSSYRYSDSWAENHATEGKSQVARTGKFGIGFLAAFLLGEKVKVTTRHRDDDMGYKFEFDVHSRPLDVERVEKDKPGTTIEIVMKAGTIDRLKRNQKPSWHDWYAFDDPTVLYYWDGTRLVYTGLPASRHPGKYTNWLQIGGTSFDAFFWSPSSKSSDSSFFCNGIRILNPVRHSLRWGRLDVPYPNISLLDTEDRLDIDISRSNLRSFSDEQLLISSVIHLQIARLLSINWNSEDDYHRNLSSGFSNSEYMWLPFLFNHHGYTIADAFIMDLMNIRQYYLLDYHKDTLQNCIQDIYSYFSEVDSVLIGGQSGICTDSTSRSIKRLPFYKQFTHKTPLDFAYAYYKGNEFHLYPTSTENTIYIACRDIWMHRSIYDELHNDSPEYLLGAVFSTTDSVHLSRSEQTSQPFLSNLPNTELFPFVAHIDAPATIPGFREEFLEIDNPFIEELKNLLTPTPDYPHQDMWIPFDMEERKKKFPKAFNELKIYLDYIERNSIK